MSRLPPRRIVGVDFSGARDAGRLIWIADGLREDHALRLVSCRPASALPGGGAAREPALAALVAHIAALGEAAVGLDLPFGISETLFEAADWYGFVARCACQWPDAAAFRRACRQADPARELRRDTDREAKTPFSPYNLKLYRQTWHGLAEVIAPLVLTGRAVAAPMQEIAPDRPILMETCPASFLKLRTNGLYRPYKGAAPAQRRQRQIILRALVERGWLTPLRPSLQRRIVDNRGGDALDSVIAAIVALRASADPANLRPRPGWERRDRMEARVYF